MTPHPDFETLQVPMSLTLGAYHLEIFGTKQGHPWLSIAGKVTIGSLVPEAPMRVLR